MSNKRALTTECAELLQKLYEDLGGVKESIGWLKKSVYGIYALIGVAIAQQIYAAFR